MAWAVRVACVVAVLLPFGERFGLCDSWPAFALYASHDERSYLSVAAEDVGRLPAEIPRCCRKRIRKKSAGRTVLFPRPTGQPSN